MGPKESKCCGVCGGRGNEKMRNNVKQTPYENESEYSDSENSYMKDVGPAICLPYPEHVLKENLDALR